jgi:hypothetical protein
MKLIGVTTVISACEGCDAHAAGAEACAAPMTSALVFQAPCMQHSDYARFMNYREVTKYMLTFSNVSLQNHGKYE